MIRRKGSPQYDNSLDTGPIRKSSVEIQATGSSTTEVKVHRAKKAKTGEQALQQDTEAGEDAGDDLPSATKHDPDRPVILQLAKVKVHANNRGAFSDQELLAIYNETSSNPILHYDLSRLSFVKDRKKSTLDPVYNITGADGQYQTQTLGNFHLGPDGVMMRGHAHQTKWHFSEGTKLLWEYGCFNLRSESHPTVEEICRRAIRDSHPEYLRGGGSEKDFMKKTSNMVGKRFKACLRRWFVVGDDADLPEMIQTLYKNKTAGSARWEGMLRDYLRQSTLDKVDRNEQLRLNGHASVEANDGAPDSYEIAFEPRTEPTRPLKRKRTVQASSTAEAPRSTAKSSSSTTRAPKASEASSTAATTSSPRRPRAPSPHYRPDAQAAPTRATCGPDLDRHELLWNLSFSGRSRK